MRMAYGVWTSGQGVAEQPGKKHVINHVIKQLMNYPLCGLDNSLYGNWYNTVLNSSVAFVHCIRKYVQNKSDPARAAWNYEDSPVV